MYRSIYIIGLKTEVNNVKPYLIYQQSAFLVADQNIILLTNVQKFHIRYPKYPSAFEKCKNYTDFEVGMLQVDMII